tara:strand:+ start:595 stop:1194 length:600 start_codon:yes stop_codon:yes gene_type:complete
MVNNNFIIINNENTLIKNILYNEYVILLDYTNYKNEIYKSYKNNSKRIYKQFLNDFPRAKYHINNVNETNIYLFIDYFEFLIHQYKLDYSEFLMLCTQAVMGAPLEKLYSIINNVTRKQIDTGNSKELYIGEPKKNKKMLFNFIVEKNELYININKILRVFYINKIGKDITLYNININIIIPYLSKENIIITYKILKNK